MYYRDDSDDYNEKINTVSNYNYDEEDYDYEEFFKNMPYNRQQTPYAPNSYGMIPFYPMIWNMQNLKNYDNNYRSKGSENLEQYMPMEHMPVPQEKDGDLKMLYPKIYISIYPMVKHHCDMMVSMHGKMHCPDKDEMDHMSKEICEEHEKHHRDDEEDDNLLNDDEYNRQRRRFHRRRGIQDLIKILFIRELLGRRHGGGYWG
jgi:hypothetical protein